MSVLLTQVLTSAGGVGTGYPAPRVLVEWPAPLAPMRMWFQLIFADGAHQVRRLAWH